MHSVKDPKHTKQKLNFYNKHALQHIHIIFTALIDHVFHQIIHIILVSSCISTTDYISFVFLAYHQQIYHFTRVQTKAIFSNKNIQVL